MGIGRWFSFAGRIRRRTWWLGYVLPILAISILGTVIDVMLGFVTLVAEDAMPADGFAVATSGFGPFSIAALLVTIVGGLAGQVKRWHDRDKSGWWVLIALIPIVGPIWALVELGFLSGTEGPNRFGPDPRGGAGAPQWQPAPAAQGWQPGPPQWQQPPAQPQWQPPPAQGWQPPAQGQGQGAYPPPGWQPPPQGYPPPQQGYGQPPPGYGQPPPGHGQPPPGYGQPPPGYGQQQPPPGPWQGPGPGGGSVPPVRRD